MTEEKNSKKVIRVERDEYELDDGVVLPIMPPLDRDMTPEEFQEHHERAILTLSRLEDSWRLDPDAKELGRERNTEDGQNTRRAPKDPSIRDRKVDGTE